MPVAPSPEKDPVKQRCRIVAFPPGSAANCNGKLFFNCENDLVMREEKSSRKTRVGAWLTANEWDMLSKEFKISTSKKLSDHLRRKILGKPVTVYHRNKSLDEFIPEMLLLRKELNAIGVNYSQVVNSLKSMPDLMEVKVWLKIHESSWQLMQKKVDEIRFKIIQINDQWLR